jgi:FkbM family methyltransferase
MANSTSNSNPFHRWRARFLDYLRRKRKRRAGRRWGRDKGIHAERLRYSYDLGPESVVFDCGAHLGFFAAEIFRRYQCDVFCFEPMPRHFKELSKRFTNTPRIVCLNYGIAPTPGEAKISVEGEASSLFRTTGSTESETVRFVGLDEALRLAGGRKIDLLKLNIEGGEFELLETILARQLANQFRNIQVQFHQVIPDYHERWLKIRAGLAKSHRLTYDYYFVFENWSLCPKQA